MADADIRFTCEEDRCQSSDENGNLCSLKRTPTSPYCAKHGGVVREKDLMQNYNLTKYKAEMNGKLRSDSILSLREEIGVARITLETVINQCKGPVDLLMYQPKIVQLVQTIQKTVESCQRIEEKTSHLLSKTAILQFADELLEIIKENVPDQSARANISNSVLLKLQTLDNSTE